jgi:threonine dehydrogenase-like Zn-dependent dehydrogenase
LLNKFKLWRLAAVKRLVPAANVHEVPAPLDWEEAVLIEPFTIGAQACRRVNAWSGGRAGYGRWSYRAL